MWMVREAEYEPLPMSLRWFCSFSCCSGSSPCANAIAGASAAPNPLQEGSAVHHFSSLASAFGFREPVPTTPNRATTSAAGRSALRIRIYGFWAEIKKDSELPQPPQADPRGAFLPARRPRSSCRRTRARAGSYVLGPKVAPSRRSLRCSPARRSRSGSARAPMRSTCSAGARHRAGRRGDHRADTFAPTALAIEAVGATPVLRRRRSRRRVCIDPAARGGDHVRRRARSSRCTCYGHRAPTRRDPGDRAHATASRSIEDCAQAHGARLAGGRSARSATRRRSASTRPRTSARSATRARSSPSRRSPLARAPAQIRLRRTYRFIETGQRAARRTAGCDPARTPSRGLEALNAQRRTLAARYRARLEGAVSLQPDHDGFFYHHFAITLENRDAVKARLFAAHGIGSKNHCALRISPTGSRCR